MAVYAFKTGLVDTTYAGVSVTPGVQQAADLVLKDDSGNTVTAATPKISNRQAHSYTYNGNGTVATETFNGITRTYTYDANGNVTGIA